MLVCSACFNNSPNWCELTYLFAVVTKSSQVSLCCTLPPLLYFTPLGSLSNSEDIEAIVHGMGPLRLATRSAASSALTSTVNPSTSAAALPQPRGSEERRRAGSRTAGESPDTSRRTSGRGQSAPRGAGRGRAGRGFFPPPIETRVVPGQLDEVELVSAAR